MAAMVIKNQGDIASSLVRNTLLEQLRKPFKLGIIIRPAIITHADPVLLWIAELPLRIDVFPRPG